MREYRFYGWQTADIKDKRGLTPCNYYDLLVNIWCRETCAPRLRGEWNVENPTVGQCSVTAFLMQEMFGGDVYGIPMKGGNYHCFNVVNNCVFDLTSEQFGNTELDYNDSKQQFRDIHFAKTEKRERYELLRSELLNKLEQFFNV